MYNRPKIKIDPSPFDKKLDKFSFVLLIAFIAFSIFAFFNLPQTIPIHFGANGLPDGYGNKKTILLLPILGVLIYFLLTYLCTVPHIFNYMVTITEQNALQQYTFSIKMLRWLKLIVLILFSYIVLGTYLTSVGFTNGIGGYFALITLMLILGIIIYHQYKSIKAK